MSKRNRMLKRNRERREAEYRTLLTDVFSGIEIASMSPEDTVSLGSAYKREKAIEDARIDALARADERERLIVTRKREAELCKFRAEVAERKREAILS